MNKFKVFGTLGLVAVIGLLYLGRWSMTSEVTDTFARDSERVCSSSNSTQCKYVSFGNNETYENTDTWWFFKFNSSDLEKDFVKGNTCKLTLFGMRAPLFSWHRNIVKADCS